MYAATSFWLRISNGRGRLIRSRCHAQGVVVVLTSTMRHPFHIQARWRNVGSRSRNAKGNAESDEQGRKCTEVRFCGGLPRSSAEVSVMDMERRR